MLPFFTNTALLTGLAGIAAPILIHLLLRRKSQRLRFSTIQFFVKKDERSMRKRKLRNLLLLTARIILFALIVLAFSRPFLRGGGATAALTQRQQVIVLLDSSASMQGNGPGGQQWTRAKDLARKVLAGLQADDRAALLSCSTRTATISEFAPPSVVAQKLTDLQPTWGSGELTEGLRHALKLLTVSNPEYATTLYIVSDLQRGSCQNLTTVPLPNSVTVKILDLGERFIPNVSVTDLQLERQNQIEPHAVVTSFSDENYARLKIGFKIDAKPISSGDVILPESATATMPLSIPALTPGWHSFEARIESKDGLAIDDTRYATIFVPEPVHGLIVETRNVPKVFQQESYFIAAALDPARGTNQESTARFALEKTTLENLPQKLKPQAGQSRNEFVILPGVKQISTAAATALASYVQAGGGLMLFANENISANTYNTVLRDLLPGELEKIQTVRDNEATWHIAEFSKTSPMFSIFAEPNSGNLLLPEFTHRFGITPNAGGSIIAEFNDGVPLAMERKMGQGRIVLINTSADTSWTDWQKHKTFVPWLHASANFLAGRDAAADREATATFVSGTQTDFELVAKKQAVKFQRMGDREMSLMTDDEGRLRDVPLDVPGIYSLKDSTGRELRRFAVNLPATESNLSSLTPVDLEQQLVRSAQPSQQTLSAGLFGDPTRGKELWRMLLLSALTLMLIEPILANKTLA